jgi:hypothetical protein
MRGAWKGVRKKAYARAERSPKHLYTSCSIGPNCCLLNQCGPEMGIPNANGEPTAASIAAKKFLLSY